MTSRKQRPVDRLLKTTSSEDEEEPLEDEEIEQPNAEAEEDQDDEEEPDLADPFIAWFAQETSGNPVDFENLPEFNAEFAKLVEKTTFCPVEFTLLLRKEAYISYSYEKFVTRLGGEATYIFDVFGITIIKKCQVSFLNAWILAQYYLRKNPLIHPGDPTVDVAPFFDITMFDIQQWEEYWIVHRCTKREEFICCSLASTRHMTCTPEEIIR